MSEYTPTTAEVRGVYTTAGFRENMSMLHQSVEEWRAEFDRWLAAYTAEVREQVAAEVWDEGYSVGFYAREALPGDSRDASEGSGTNPYRTRKDADHE